MSVGRPVPPPSAAARLDKEHHALGVVAVPSRVLLPIFHHAVRRFQGMNMVPNMMSPKTAVWRKSPVRVGQPREAIDDPNTDDVSLYMNGDATRRKMRADRTEIQALSDASGVAIVVVVYTRPEEKKQIHQNEGATK